MHLSIQSLVSMVLQNPNRKQKYLGLGCSSDTANMAATLIGDLVALIAELRLLPCCCRTQDETCALNLASPCLYNDTLYSNVTEVKTLNFTTLPFQTFFQDYVGCPATNLVRFLSRHLVLESVQLSVVSGRSRGRLPPMT